MAISTHTEQFTYPGELDRPLIIHKSKTLTGNDICFSDGDYDYIHDTIRFSDAVNLLDYQSLSEYNMSCYTRHALELLPKKDILIITYVAEALNSTYWNVVLDIVCSFGYKEVIWVDGGLTPGYLYGHLSNLRVSHRTGTMFFNTLLRDGIGLLPTPEKFTQRSKYFLSLARLARRERIYFTDKLLHDKDLASKGIYSCGWGEDSIHTTWNKNCPFNSENLKLLLDEDRIQNFPITLNHADSQQHHFIPGFDECVFNVVMESSVGFNPTSHEHQYTFISPNWCRVNSDRLFFTEKTGKAFLMSQLPIFIAAPGYVNALRSIGFDVFDDIIDHSYDKEDYINKRCDMVFNELKRLVEMHSLEAWNTLLKQKLQHRLLYNFNHMKELGNNDHLTNWINSRF
jgi:hypothetical protein